MRDDIRDLATKHAGNATAVLSQDMASRNKNSVAFQYLNRGEAGLFFSATSSLHP